MQGCGQALGLAGRRPLKAPLFSGSWSHSLQASMPLICAGALSQPGHSHLRHAGRACTQWRPGVVSSFFIAGRTPRSGAVTKRTLELLRNTFMLIKM